MVKIFGVIAWLILLLTGSYLATTRLSFHPTFPYYDTDLAKDYSRLTAVPAHFDGIHYLRLAKKGYDDEGSQAFFPLYPLLINLVSRLGIAPLYSGMLISGLCLLGLSRLLSTRAFILLLASPASFYLASVYTESLFLFLLSVSFYLLSARKYFLATLVIALLSATRLVGIAMLVPLAFALWGRVHKLVVYLPLACSGFVSYLLYLWTRFGDPLMFMRVQPLFGGGRVGEGVILLPQVLYRYFKIALTVPPNTWVFWRSGLELLIFILFLYLLYFLRKKIPPSHLLYSLLVILIPSLSGSLSSMPRYALAALPVFVGLGTSLPRRALVLTLLISLPLLFVLTMIFASGKFVA